MEIMATDNEPAVVEVATSAKSVVDESIPLVLVTGATGYIATHVIQQLLLSGKYRVRGTIRSLKNEEKVKALKELVPDAKYPLDLCEADLQNTESWPPAVQGCKYVLHIASPFPSSVPKNPDEVIRPAMDGTINVLTACAESGSVKKVVVTSSIAAISCGGIGHPNRQEHVYTEEDWSLLEACPPYERSKTLAEKAAWKFIEDLPEEKKFDLAVINPGFVQGPALTKGSGTSVNIVTLILAGKVPGAVDVSFAIVDVRDVAQAHIVAMEKPECNGKRYLLVGESNVHFIQVLQWMAEEFGPQGYKISTMKIPKFVAWFASIFSSEMKLIYPNIGKRITYVNDKMINELGIQPRSAKESFIETAYSIIELGMVGQTAKYHGPGGKPETKPASSVQDDDKVKTDDTQIKATTANDQSYKETDKEIVGEEPKKSADVKNEKQTDKTHAPAEDIKDKMAPQEPEKPNDEGKVQDNAEVF